jgi:hypothetical protein
LFSSDSFMVGSSVTFAVQDQLDLGFGAGSHRACGDCECQRKRPHPTKCMVSDHWWFPVEAAVGGLCAGFNRTDREVSAFE